MSDAPTMGLQDIEPIGKWEPDRAAAKLREIGEDRLAEEIEGSRGSRADAIDAFGWIRLRRRRAWQGSHHVFGFIRPNRGDGLIDIHHAGAVRPDMELKGSRLRITLDRFRVFEYPGSGRHEILIHCYAQNQLTNVTEELNYSIAVSIPEGDEAAFVGYPIFTGLRVGTEGLTFGCLTVNVQNRNDHPMLAYLRSNAITAGLTLAGVYQPAVVPLSALARGLVETMATKHKNIPVQKFTLGMDFSYVSTRACLAEGSYIAIQLPFEMNDRWSWNEWKYDSTNGRISDGQGKGLTYNYLVFGVSRCE